ncbi:holo-ACP synthase [Candidatus Woesearchaeota archaeon]|nr:MAG: holo-ACP synthase [Candidatus Woesearchaeota archaeon]
MDVVGIGIDILELKKVRKLLKGSTSESFLKKTFTAKERKYFEKQKDPIPHIATTFAAKEAIFKALGVGWQEGKEIEIVRKSNGPKVVLKGKLKKTTHIRKILLSLSYTSKLAVAVAVLLA